MGVILILLGILCFPFAVNSPMYVAFGIGFILWGGHIMPVPKGKSKPGRSGSFTESLNGVLRDHEGHEIERDDDGELRLR